MAESRTYTGPLPRGRILLATRSVSFTKGEPVEFTADEAAGLDDDWAKPKPPKPPKSQGSTPEPKES